MTSRVLLVLCALLLAYGCAWRRGEGRVVGRRRRKCVCEIERARASESKQARRRAAVTNSGPHTQTTTQNHRRPPTLTPSPPPSTQKHTKKHSLRRPHPEGRTPGQGRRPPRRVGRARRPPGGVRPGGEGRLVGRRPLQPGRRARCGCGRRGRAVEREMREMREREHVSVADVLFFCVARHARPSWLGRGAGAAAAPRLTPRLTPRLFSLSASLYLHPPLTHARPPCLASSSCWWPSWRSWPWVRGGREAGTHARVRAPGSEALPAD
jgi:hypothetical protein